MAHPHCIGEVRQQVLHRLEELAFPPGPTEMRNAVIPSVVSGALEPSATGLLAVGQVVWEKKWERERKFRTISDAVAWLKVHHPEIDLDAPYKPRR